MERIRSLLARAAIGLIVLAGFGLGVMATGVAVVLGAAFVLALRLSVPRRHEREDPREAPAFDAGPEKA